jgi:Ran GTPase-activating protein (RanGAP) involved in mRNA processing and transport
MLLRLSKVFLVFASFFVTLCDFSSNMRYGDKYADLLSDGLKKVTNVNQFFLKNNRINNQGADELLQTISVRAKIIDLQSNSVGRLGCEHISQALLNRECRLEILNLENNKLGDSCVMLVADSL